MIVCDETKLNFCSPFHARNPKIKVLMRSLDGMEFFADAHTLCVDGRVRRLGDLGLYHVPGATKETHCLR